MTVESRQTMKRIALLSVLAAIILTSCESSQDETTQVAAASTPAPTAIETATSTAAPSSPTPTVTPTALEYSSFSRSGLIAQLEYEGFTTTQAEYGVDAQGADWNAQAALAAASYLEYSEFSRSGLIEQLEYEGFTTTQAEYGVDAVGY